MHSNACANEIAELIPDHACLPRAERDTPPPTLQLCLTLQAAAGHTLAEMLNRFHLSRHGYFQKFNKYRSKIPTRYAHFKDNQAYSSDVAATLKSSW